MQTDVVTMDKIVSLCKRRGFVFPSSEIYGGLGSSYDYGHYGVLLKNNIRAQWWRAMLQERDLRVPPGEAMALMREAMALSGDPAIGIRAARCDEPGDFDVVEYAAANCASVGETLKLAARFVALWHDGIVTQEPSPDFGNLRKDGRRIREVASEQLETGGKVSVLERADDEVQSQPRAEHSAFRTSFANAAFRRMWRAGPDDSTVSCPHHDRVRKHGRRGAMAQLPGGRHPPVAGWQTESLGGCAAYGGRQAGPLGHLVYRSDAGRRIR